MADSPRAAAFEALAHLLVSGDSLASGLTSMLDVITSAVPAASHAGLTTGDAHGRIATPVFTDPAVPDMDQAQFDSGRGPCLDCWRNRKPVRIDDLAETAGAYPEFVRAAAERGIHSTLSAPLMARDASIGAMNLYAAETRGFTDDDEQLLVDLAPAAAAFLANAKSYWHALGLAEQLDQALVSRSVIDQAKGVLMASDPNLDADGAFEILRSASRRENVKLYELAQRIVARRPPPET